MLSTRAGGLGINLTAADTVIFYEHDWNPSNDAQAMDRAHRVGQTRQVTVYRLICRGTVDERMLHLARNKKDVQDIVVGNKSLDEINAQKEIVSMLLADEDDSTDVPSFGNRSAGFGSTFATSALADVDDEDGFFSSKKTGDEEGGDGLVPKPKAKSKRKAEGDAEADGVKRPPKKRAPKPPVDGEASQSRKSKKAVPKSEPPSELPSNVGTPTQQTDTPDI